MSSRGLLRGAVLDNDPLVIDNSHYFELPVEDTVAEDLAETLQQEHPDATPEVIEEAIQDALEQLAEEPDEEPLVLGEETEDELGFGFEEDGPTLGTEAPLLLDAGFEPAETDVPFEAEAAFEAAPALPVPVASNENVIDEARREADRILAEADTRAAEIERAAYDKGYEEGLQAGAADGEQKADAILEQVVAIVDQATQLHDTMLHEAESEMVALCLEIARKIIQAELRTNPDVVKSVLAAAVQKINGSPRVTIHANPAQVDALRVHWQSAFGPNYREKEWAIEADANVAPGGCVLDTKYGSIDAQIGTQFTEIQKTFALLLGTQS